MSYDRSKDFREHIIDGELMVIYFGVIFVNMVGVWCLLREKDISISISKRILWTEIKMP